MENGDYVERSEEKFEFRLKHFIPLVGMDSYAGDMVNSESGLIKECAYNIFMVVYLSATLATIGGGSLALAKGIEALLG